MEQTPTFKCIKKCDLHHADVGDIIKMSVLSMKYFDENNDGWRKKFVELSLAEELAAIKQ